MIITEHRQISIKFKEKESDMFKRIIQGIDHMSFCRQENDIFYFLGLWIDFHDISRERIPRIVLISDDKLGFFYFHLDDLVVDRRIIEISSQQKKDQYCPDDIIIEDRNDEHARKYHCKYEVPYLASLKFFSVIDENIHTDTIKNKIWNHITRLVLIFKEKTLFKYLLDLSPIELFQSFLL